MCHNAKTHLTFFKTHLWRNIIYLRKKKKNVFVTKNDKMHTKYTIGNERALPETCIISAFELLRYQNVKRYQWEKKKNITKNLRFMCITHY